jgi:hypothetical protein
MTEQGAPADRVFASPPWIRVLNMLVAMLLAFLALLTYPWVLESA